MSDHYPDQKQGGPKPRDRRKKGGDGGKNANLEKNAGSRGSRSLMNLGPQGSHTSAKNDHRPSGKENKMQQKLYPHLPEFSPSAPDFDALDEPPPYSQVYYNRMPNMNQQELCYWGDSQKNGPNPGNHDHREERSDPRNHEERPYPSNRHYHESRPYPGGYDHHERRPYPGGYDDPERRPYPGNYDNHERRPYPGGYDHPERRPYPGGYNHPERRPYPGGYDHHESRPYPDGYDHHERRPYPGGYDHHERRPYPGGYDHPESRPYPGDYDHPERRPYPGGYNHHESRPYPSSYDHPERRPYPGGYDHPDRRSRTPPPSYYESFGESVSVTVNDLIRVLSKFDKLTETTVNIGHHLKTDPVTVFRVAESSENLFSINRRGQHPVITLDPKISLCLKNLSKRGCGDSLCQELHLCKDLIRSDCKVKNSCHSGHNLWSKHNARILSRFHLDDLGDNSVLKVLKKSCKNVHFPEVCPFYNMLGRGCKYEGKCNQLHICQKMISRSCSNDCNFNHNILAPQCRKVLQHYHVPVNESPKDILLHIKEYIELSTDNPHNPDVNRVMINEDASGLEQKMNYVSEKNSKQKFNKESEGTSKSKFNKDSEATSKQKYGKMNQGTPPKKRTLNATDLCGDVEIDQICIHLMDKACKDFLNGCKYLHAKSKFHWQMKHNGKWFNLPVYQSKELETAFCDVSLSTVQMSSLNVDKLFHSANDYCQLLGTAPWKADFVAMTISCNGEKMDIRRISTPSAAILTNSKATIFEWFFKDVKGKWIKYGQADSIGKKKLVSNVSSDAIELQFLQSSSSQMSFSNEEFTYTIDFTRMVQVNKSTGTEREIRRRPSMASPTLKKATEDKPGQNHPSNWTPMTGKYLLVDLDSYSEEYDNVSKQVQEASYLNIKSIQRLQNPYLWNAFQSKMAKLSQQYITCKTEKHFHGIDSKHLDSICSENIEWRREESCNTKYGLGTYFYKSASEARSFMTSQDCSCLVLAQVIIGEITLGKSTYKRPPVNQATGLRYDTTVDDACIPKVDEMTHRDTHCTGTYADPPARPRLPDPPDDAQERREPR